MFIFIGNLLCDILPLRWKFLYNNLNSRENKNKNGSNEYNGSKEYNDSKDSEGEGNHSSNNLLSLSYVHDDYWINMYESLKPLLTDSEKLLATIIRCYGFIMAGLNPNAFATTAAVNANIQKLESTFKHLDVQSTTVKASSGTNLIINNADIPTGATAVMICRNIHLKSMINFHVMIVGKHLLNDQHHDNETATLLLSSQLLSKIRKNFDDDDRDDNDSSSSSSSSRSSDNKDCRSIDMQNVLTTTTTTSTTPVSLDDIMSNLTCFQSLRYIVINASQKLLFTVCQSYGYFLWNIFNYDPTSTINNNYNNGGMNKIKNNINVLPYSNNNHLQQKQLMSVSVIEVIEILLYFFKYSKLKVKLQALQILLFIVTKYIEIYDNDNEHIILNNSSNNTTDGDNVNKIYLFYSKDYFTTYLLR